MRWRVFALLVLLVVVAGGAGAGVHAAVNGSPPAPRGGPLATPVECDPGYRRCYQLGRRVARPIQDDECWRDPDGGQQYVWEPLVRAGVAHFVLVCTPTI